jgi:hypothetical protein
VRLEKLPPEIIHERICMRQRGGLIDAGGKLNVRSMMFSGLTRGTWNGSGKPKYFIL